MLHSVSTTRTGSAHDCGLRRSAAVACDRFVSLVSDDEDDCGGFDGVAGETQPAEGGLEFVSSASVAGSGQSQGLVESTLTGY